jgi:hypothetical protein
MEGRIFNLASTNPQHKPKRYGFYDRQEKRSGQPAMNCSKQGLAFSNVRKRKMFIADGSVARPRVHYRHGFGADRPI